MKDRAALTSERQLWITRKTLECIANNPWIPADTAYMLAEYGRRTEDTMDEIRQMLRELTHD